MCDGPGYYVLDETGAPLRLEGRGAVEMWGAWYATADRRLAVTTIPGPDAPIRISTVFLGLDHQFGDGPPVLWETMVFGGPLDGNLERYSTRADALAGHADIVARVERAATL